MDEQKKHLTAGQRADWLVRDPDEYFAFVKQEAHEAANQAVAARHKRRKAAVHTIHDSLWVRIMRKMMR